MTNRADFTKFFDQLGTRFKPKSSASLWSNREQSKPSKILYINLRCKNILKKHGTQLHFFNGAYNGSTSVYGFSPNELHFGFNYPKQTDLLQFWPKAKTHQEYMDLIVPLAKKAREKAIKQNERILTY